MGAKVITIGNQKGGVFKTTTCGVLAYLLSQDGYKVLAVDMDSQGNLTDLLTQMDIEEFLEKTILEGIIDQDVTNYIYEVNENLHVVPADDYLATLAKVLYASEHSHQWRGRQSMALKDALEPVMDKYDYILIDTPPSLSEPMINSICCSDYALIMAQSSKWAFTAVPRFLDTVEHAQANHNQNLKVLGILRVLTDSRVANAKAMIEVIGEMWPDYCFETVLKRKAATGRLADEGLFENKELNSALEEYKDLYKELMSRVQG